MPPSRSSTAENIPHPARRYHRRAKGSSMSGYSSPNPTASSDDPPATTVLPSRRKGVISILTSRDDACAAQMTMALVHDCFIVINQAQRGAPVDSAFSLRSRLLSLYIVEEDVSAWVIVGTEAIKKLCELRDRSLFCGKHPRGRMSLDRAAEESRELQEVIQSVVDEPPLLGVDCELLDSIQHSLSSVPPAKQVHVIRQCNSIRKFFDLGPWRPHSVKTPPSNDDDELFLLHDIFHSLEFLHAEEQPGYDNEDSLISLSISSSAREHMQSLILARDLLSGALSGPCTLRVHGAFSMYVRPLLQFRTKRSTLDEDLEMLENAFVQKNGQESYWLSYVNSRRGLGSLLGDDCSAIL